MKKAAVELSENLSNITEQPKPMLRKSITNPIEDNENQSNQTRVPSFINRTSSLPLKFDNQTKFEPINSKDKDKDGDKEFSQVIHL